MEHVLLVAVHPDIRTERRIRTVTSRALDILSASARTYRLRDGTSSLLPEDRLELVFFRLATSATGLLPPLPADAYGSTRLEATDARFNCVQQTMLSYDNLQSRSGSYRAYWTGAPGFASELRKLLDACANGESFDGFEADWLFKQETVCHGLYVVRPEGPTLDGLGPDIQSTMELLQDEFSIFQDLVTCANFEDPGAPCTYRRVTKTARLSQIPSLPATWAEMLDRYLRMQPDLPGNIFQILRGLVDAAQDQRLSIAPSNVPASSAEAPVVVDPPEPEISLLQQRRQRQVLTLDVSPHLV